MRVVTEGLTKRFGGVIAAEDVHIDVSPGEIVAVLGANGSGKSTLLKMISGLLRPTTGSIALDGGPPLDARSRVGYVGHEPHLYPALTAAENLAFFARLYAQSPDVDGWISDAGLGHRHDATVSSLSRGETQKLAIARALLHDPDLLLLDEPFTGLDEASADALPDRVARPGRTIILVSHDTERAKQMCDRSLTMDLGRIA